MRVRQRLPVRAVPPVPGGREIVVRVVVRRCGIGRAQALVDERDPDQHDQQPREDV
jgi:hypothetical protein